MLRRQNLESFCDLKTSHKREKAQRIDGTFFTRIASLILILSAYIHCSENIGFGLR
jgi:ribosomal protein S19E (S16A)